MSQIKLKRGIKANLPSSLPLGEPAFCLDTQEMYVGQGNGKPLIKVNAQDFNEIDSKFKQTNAQLLQNKNELSDKIQEVASTGTTTEVLQSTTENYIEQKLNDGTIAHLLIEDGGVTPEKTSFIGAGLNLFDKNSLKDGYLYHLSGEFVSELDSNLMVSSFIPVKNGDILYYSDVTGNYTTF